MKEGKRKSTRNQSLRKSIYKKNRLRFYISIINIFLVCIFNVYIAFFLKRAVDATTSGNLDQLRLIIIQTALIIMVYIIIGILGKRIRASFIMHGMINYKNSIIKAMLKKELKDFRNSNTGSYISMLTNDINIIQSDYINGILDMIANFMLFFAGLISMIAINYKMLIIVVVISFVPTVIASLFGNPINKRLDALSIANIKYTSLIKDVFSGFTVIKSFNVEREIYKVGEKANSEVETSRSRHYLMSETSNLIVGATSFLIVIVTFSLGGYWVVKGVLTVGSLMAFVQLLNLLLDPIQKIGEGMNKIKAAKGIMNKIDNIVMKSEDKTDLVIKKHFSNNIAINNLTFEYLEGNTVLDNINTKFEKNKSYAIVGASGSGKSTFVKLLLGYYENYKGTIDIDGNNIEDIDKASLYELISVIQQDVFIFDDSIKNNIALYKEYSDEEIKEVIELAGMQDFVDIKGLDYLCGENGNALSGGQNQRISIGRALIKRTPILIMDEAMASLDPHTALKLENQIQKLKGMTRIIVTHNISEDALRGYDEIIFMKNGRIIEQGSFDSLIKDQGNFYSFYRLEIV